VQIEVPGLARLGVHQQPPAPDLDSNLEILRMHGWICTSMDARSCAKNFNVTPCLQVAAIIEQIPSELPEDHRFVVAIAGPPAAGKSTLATALVKELGPRAGLLAMDGFHFDNVILDERGHRARKGAPHTFDVASFSNTLRFIRDEPTIEVAAPVYDRDLGLSRNCASIVRPAHEILVTEGNYLLLDEEPWSELLPLFDLTVWIDVPLTVVEQRIEDRWRTAAMDTEEVRRRTDENDIPNARLVHAGSVAADLVVPTDSSGGSPELR
jgi:pantothenate kinase